MASFQRRAPAAVAASAHRAARIPVTLLAAIEAPVPVQQATIACSARPAATSCAARAEHQAQSCALVLGQGAVEQRLVTAGAQQLDESRSATPVSSSAATAIRTGQAAATAGSRAAPASASVATSTQSPPSHSRP